MLKILLTAASVLALAGPASAFTYFSVGALTGPSHGDPGPARGQKTIITFDAGSKSGVLPKAGVTTTVAKGVTETVTGDVGLYTGNTFVGGRQIAAAPAGDTTQYEALGPGGMAIFDFSGYEKTHTINSLSLYIGSVDPWNTLVFFNKSGGKIATITGAHLPSTSGDQGASITNRRAYFAFGPRDHFASLELFSTGIAFEYDNIAVGPARYDMFRNGDTPLSAPDWVQTGVPEPSAWAAMLAGFVSVGFALRRRAKSIVA